MAVGDPPSLLFGSPGVGVPVQPEALDVHHTQQGNLASGTMDKWSCWYVTFLLEVGCNHATVPSGSALGPASSKISSELVYMMQWLKRQLWIPVFVFPSELPPVAVLLTMSV